MAEPDESETKPTPPKTTPDVGSEPSDNPYAQGLNVTVSLPETVDVRMVDASALADYEVLFFISSVLASAVSGFAVAYIQADDPKQAKLRLIFTTILAILFAILISWTLLKRRSLARKSKTVKIQYAQVEQKKRRTRNKPTKKTGSAPKPVDPQPATSDPEVEHNPGEP